MKSTLKNFIKKTPVYLAIRNLKYRYVLKMWDLRGKPVPPPHIVKQRVIKEFSERYGITVLIETGTCYGEMVEAMKNYFHQIYSIELSDELYQLAKRRFSCDSRITIIHGDSGIELGKLIGQLNRPALFWLDGHYSAGPTARGIKDTPIYEELTHIFSHPHEGHVIIIDDARCFGTDPAYPTINELKEFTKAHSPNVTIEIECDSIRIVPFSGSSLNRVGG